MCAAREEHNRDVPLRFVAVWVLARSEHSELKGFLDGHAGGVDHGIGRISRATYKNHRRAALDGGHCALCRHLRTLFGRVDERNVASTWASTAHFREDGPVTDIHGAQIVVVGERA